MKLLLTIASILSISISFSQAEKDSTEKKNKKFQLHGYVKYMTTNSFVDADNIYTDHLVHNRLNFRYRPSKSWNFQFEMRNRLFWGESLELDPVNYAAIVGNDNGEIDMSFNLAETNSLVLNSTIDRANIEFHRGKWNIRLGRQRINWGINTAWNPNDLFNAYNFIDFDYAERPGSDALRIQFFPKEMSTLEAAIRPGENMDKSVIAGLFKFNKWRYDFQLLGGNFYTDVTAGLGWAGNIWKFGFKGEASYFHPKESFQDTSGVGVVSVGLDYTFERGIFMSAAGLYNSYVSSGNLFALQSNFTTLSAKNLLPVEWAVLYTLSGAFTPIFGGALTTMYLPTVDGLFLIPTLSYSIKENWDIDFVGQLLFADYGGKFDNLSNALFFRLRWSY